MGSIWTIPQRLFWSGYTAWYARQDATLPYWSPERLQALQDRRVRHIARYAYQTVPYYRELFDRERVSPDDIRSADDLRRLPIVESSELTLAPDRFVSSRFRREQGVELHSSGVSGNAKKVYWDPAGLFQTLASKHRYRQVLRHYVGATYGYREMSVSNPLNVGVALRDFYTRYAWFPPGVEFERERALVTESFDDILGQINAFKPDVLGGSGVTLGALYRYALQRQIPVFRPKLIRYGASTMPAHDRALIESEFGVPVISSYQSAEMLRIAYQCERREGFHICTDQVAHRVVDEAGRDVAPGETGRIVLTCLVNRATVLLNYALGDLVEQGEGACPCGRTLPVINALQGRAFDLIVLPKGQRVHADVLFKTFAHSERLIQTQLEQFALDRYTLRVVSDGVVPWPELQTAIDRQLRQTIAEDIELTIEPCEFIAIGATGKIKACISHVQ
jgi:phenylacetate-CoA ligase